jgi:hypothetical protein
VKPMEISDTVIHLSLFPRKGIISDADFCFLEKGFKKFKADLYT